jgi:hypothetical protein
MAPAQGAPYGYPAQGGVNPQSYYAGAAMAAVPGAYGAYGGAAAPAGGVQPGYGTQNFARNPWPNGVADAFMCVDRHRTGLRRCEWRRQAAERRRGRLRPATGWRAERYDIFANGR